MFIAALSVPFYLCSVPYEPHLFGSVSFSERDHKFCKITKYCNLKEGFPV